MFGSTTGVARADQNSSKQKPREDKKQVHAAPADKGQVLEVCGPVRPVGDVDEVGTQNEEDGYSPESVEFRDPLSSATRGGMDLA